MLLMAIYREERQRCKWTSARRMRSEIGVCGANAPPAMYNIFTHNVMCRSEFDASGLDGSDLSQLGLNFEIAINSTQLDEQPYHHARVLESKDLCESHVDIGNATANHASILTKVITCEKTLPPRSSENQPLTTNGSVDP